MEKEQVTEEEFQEEFFQRIDLLKEDLVSDNTFNLVDKIDFSISEETGFLQVIMETEV